MITTLCIAYLLATPAGGSLESNVTVSPAPAATQADSYADLIEAYADKRAETLGAVRALAATQAAEGGVAGTTPGDDPVGACCDTLSNVCIDDLTFCECIATVEFAFWTAEQTCADTGCPPVGSCCLPSTSECTDDVTLNDCNATGGFWDTLPCAELDCPPDFGTGACCNPESGECIDDVGFFECSGTGGVSSLGLTCADVQCPPVPVLGACCAVATETCTPDVDAFTCLFLLGGEWHEGLTCEDINCPPVGACCDTTTGNCVDAVSEAACVSTGSLWYVDGTCADVGCPGETACGVVDPSFESGGLTGYLTEDMTVPLFPLSVVGSGVNTFFFIFFFPSEPTDGDSLLLHGFDGDGPGTISAAQDVDVPGDGLMLMFDYRAGWDLANFCAAEDRTFSVSIEPAGGGAPYETHEILRAEAGTVVSDTGNQVGLLDVREYSATSIRIRFHWWIPEAFSGPGIFQLDNLQCLSGGDKIEICHRPPGNPDNARTIEVSVNSLMAHLAHGDTIGPCED